MQIDYSIEELLPQRPPMIMVDRLVHCDQTLARTELAVRADNLMVEDGHLSATGLIENAAQTCAARIGYISLINGQEVSVGVIGAVREMQIHSLPPVGSLVETEMRVETEMFGMTLAKVQSRCGSTVLCEGTMKIALL